MTIDVQKLKADIANSKDPATTILQAVRAEAQALRLADGGAAMVTVDAFVAQIDTVIAQLAAPPKN